MLTDYRSNDAVLTICQNNKTKSIIIHEVNQAVHEAIGYSSNELLGRPLSDILPGRITELLEEYVEFESDANDVGVVLSKVQSFSIIGRNGKEKAYKVKIVRAHSSGSMLFFLLVLQDSLGVRQNESIRKIIRENFKGHESLDPQTDLPDRESLIKDIGVMKRYSHTNDMVSCFAVLQIDKYNELLAENGREMGDEIVKYVGSVVVNSMRPDDVVGSVGNGLIGILLVDIAGGSERLVLNRLRWQIAANPYIDEHKNAIGLSVSIGFCDIEGDGNDAHIIEQCEAALDGLAADSHNVLVEASV